MLPPRLSLSADGQLSGTPTAPAIADLTFRVTDSSGSATRSLTLTVLRIGGFVPDSDPLLHYTFDEGSGTRIWDAAPVGNNQATDVPGAHWIPDSRSGGAYGPSNAANYLNHFFPANQADLDSRGEPYTISVWVRASVTGGYNTILGKDNGISPNNSQFRLWVPSTTNSLQGINGNQYGGTLNVAANPLNNGQWNLVTLVNYLDGTTWLAALANPPAIAFRGLHDDSDQDGLVNLLEYVLGTHPNNPASWIIPVLTRSAGTVSLSYSRLRADLFYQVETSPNVDHRRSHSGHPPIGQTATATFPITSETTHLFLRLRVSE